MRVCRRPSQVRSAFRNIGTQWSNGLSIRQIIKQRKYSATVCGYAGVVKRAGLKRIDNCEEIQ